MLSNVPVEGVDFSRNQLGCLFGIIKRLSDKLTQAEYANPSLIKELNFQCSFQILDQHITGNGGGPRAKRRELIEQ